MNDTHAERAVSQGPDPEITPSVDDLLIQSISRWALANSLGIALFDLAILASYPFPNALDAARGPLYGLFALVLLLATLAISFLGYRILSMRIVRRSRSVYLIFLPAMLLIASLLAFTIMTSPK